MKEELLHYVWKTKNFHCINLHTTQYESLEIDKFGIYNLNAGPDFLEGKVTLNGTQWYGHVEMHIRSSDWIRHNHQTDRAYENVILHVVWEEDKIIYHPDGTRIPCLEMKTLIPNYLIEGYERFMLETSEVKCSSSLLAGETDLFYFQLNRLFIERLEEKSYPISLELEENGQDWSKLLFLLISKSLGLKVNADAMESLARNTPYKLIQKHVDNVFQLEAILYGQAGMLSVEIKDQYYNSLKKEYTFLKNKYKLTPLNGRQWKLMRMRPGSFPTVRISQLAQLYNAIPDLHSKILNSTSIDELMHLFEIQAGEYWDSHYLFGKESTVIPKKTGKNTRINMIVNAVVPFLFAYGQYRAQDEYIERAIQIMNSIPAENNKIIKKWKSLNIHPDSAYQSQGLLHLYKNYCTQGRCLECTYGNKVIKEISQAVFREKQIKFAS